MDSTKNAKLLKFLDTLQEGHEYCDSETKICYVKTKDGLIERKLVERKLVVEDGRQILTEERPISNTRRQYLR